MRRSAIVREAEGMCALNVQTQMDVLAFFNGCIGRINARSTVIQNQHVHLMRAV